MTVVEKYQFTLPPGRIVQGSPTFRQDKDPQGRPKDKPNWFFAVAIAKPSPGIDQHMAAIYQLACAGYQGNSAVLQRINAGISGGFRWKIEDGDNPENKSHIGREGYAGCWIFKFSTSLGVPPCGDQTGMLIDPAMIKCGHYVDVAVSVDINGNVDHTAGVYLNPQGVRLLGYGREIVSGPTFQQLFANTPPVLPAGASSTPLPPAAGAVGFPVAGQAVMGVPAQAQGGFPVGSAAAPGFLGTASPTNQQVQAAYPGATPVPGFGAVR